MSDKPFNPTVNKNVPQVGEPVADLGSLLTVTKSLKQGLESLGGYRGDIAGRAVTFIDLVGLGLVPGTTFNMETGTGAGGVATVVNLEQETAARKAGDQNLQVGLDTEEAERIADVNTEEAARIAADNAEAATRAADDDIEEAARIAADQNLQNQIDQVGENFIFNQVVGTAGATIPVGILAGAHEMVVMITGSGAITVNTPTADEIIAAVPFWQIGGIYRFRVCNPTPGTINISPGTGVTITGLTNITTNKWREWLVRYMAASSVDFRDIGSGDA